MKRGAESALTALLVLVIGIAGALLLAHAAACEQYEGFCSLSK